MRFLILATIVADSDCVSKYNLTIGPSAGHALPHCTYLLQYQPANLRLSVSSRSFTHLLVMLIAFILAASLPFVLRKPAVVDQSTPFVIEHRHVTIRVQDEVVDKETAKTSGTVTWNQDGAGVDHAVVYLFRVDRRAKEFVEASRTYTDSQGEFEMLTPAGLEVQIFVDTQDAKNVPAKLKERIEKEATSKGNVL